MSNKVVDACLWCKNKKLDLFCAREDDISILECQNCKLIMLGEVPVDLKEAYYNEDYYTNSERNVVEKAGYDEVYELMAPAFLMWEQSVIATLSRINKSKTRLLEVGCATGALLDMTKELNPDIEVTGIDISDYAAWVCNQKGHEAYAIQVEEFHAKNNYDIIFSSETLEHLDEPMGFLHGIKQNLNKDGVFVFYVPSISRADALEHKTKYVRFVNNLEHLLHFTPEFLQGALTETFGKEVIIKEFDAGFGPYIVGAVTSSKKYASEFSEIMDAVQNEKTSSKDTKKLIDIAVISLKFGKFEFAQKLKNLISALQKSQDKSVLLEGLMGYHKGEIINSSKSFEKYLTKNPTSLLAIKSLYANERILKKMYEVELYTKIKELEMLKLNESHTNKNRRPIQSTVNRAKRAINNIYTKSN